MKGFIEITPRSYNGDFSGNESSWTISEPERLNINSIVKFGNNFIFTSNSPEAYPVLVVEDYEKIKKLIIDAQ